MQIKVVEINVLCCNELLTLNTTDSCTKTVHLLYSLYSGIQIYSTLCVQIMADFEHQFNFE